MDIRLAIPSAQADAVRSGIYAFVSTLEARNDVEGSVVFITVAPIGQTWEYRLEFADPDEGEAFLAFLPTIFPGESPSKWITR